MVSNKGHTGSSGDPKEESGIKCLPAWFMWQGWELWNAASTHFHGQAFGTQTESEKSVKREKPLVGLYESEPPLKRQQQDQEVVCYCQGAGLRSTNQLCGPTLWDVAINTKGV